MIWFTPSDSLTPCDAYFIMFVSNFMHMNKDCFHTRESLFIAAVCTKSASVHLQNVSNNSQVFNVHTPPPSQLFNKKKHTSDQQLLFFYFIVQFVLSFILLFLCIACLVVSALISTGKLLYKKIFITTPILKKLAHSMRYK